MIHPHTELRLVSPEIGRGVFATQFIPRGTLTWVLCELDRVFTPQQVEALPAAYRQIMDTYAYINADGTWVMCWDWGRYMNHACDPNTLGLTAFADVAVRDIHPGEEVTCDYGMLNLTADMACRCGSPYCRQRIGADDALQLATAWDEVIAGVVPSLGQVEQQLASFVQDSRFLEHLVKGQAALPSTRSYHRAS